MLTRVLIACFAVFPLFINMALAAAPFAVETKLGSWIDKDRANREVPYKIYVPKSAQGAVPVVLFSHGLGGNRDGAVYLLEYLASYGYAVLAVQHRGSDTEAVFGNSPSANPSGNWRNNVREATSPESALNRFHDISFAIDQLEEMNRNDVQLRGKLDLTHVGMSGHSYGAITTLAISGQTASRMNISFSDYRVKAAIAYSPSKPKQGNPDDAFSQIRIPTFHMTGTEDHNPLDPSEPPSNRQIPYRSIKAADKFLLVFAGGDHMVFSGREGRNGPRPNDEAFRALVQKASLAFWDMYLKDKPEARNYLTGGGFKSDLGALGAYEFVVR